MLYKKEGKTKDGIKYEVLEETTIYTLENREQHEIIVEKLNKQLGFDGLKVEDVSYPYTFVVDVQELLDLEEKRLAQTNDEEKSTVKAKGVVRHLYEYSYRCPHCGEVVENKTPDNYSKPISHPCEHCGLPVLWEPTFDEKDIRD